MQKYKPLRKIVYFSTKKEITNTFLLKFELILNFFFVSVFENKLQAK